MNFKLGSKVQIKPEWQDPGDDQFERTVIEAPNNSPRVLISTHIPGFTILPTEWIDIDKLQSL
jgi:hypothetical protein